MVLRGNRLYGCAVFCHIEVCFIHIGVGSVRCSFNGTGQMREPRKWSDNERFTLFLCRNTILSRSKVRGHIVDIDELTSRDVRMQGKCKSSNDIGLTPNVIPERQNPTTGLVGGVSTKYAPDAKPNDKQPHWYALRTTYGREMKAYEYITGHGGTAYCPTLTVIRADHLGHKSKVEVSRIPNIFFAYGTEQEIKAYVYDNVNLPYLRFYYRHHHERGTIVREPLIVPDTQMNSLRVICAAESADTIITTEAIRKFQAGQQVRVCQGLFAGVIGRVARYQGQQRVAVAIDGLLTAVTAYVPSAFLVAIGQPQTIDMQECPNGQQCHK